MRVTYPFVVLLLAVAAAHSEAQLPEPGELSRLEYQLKVAEMERAQQVLVPVMAPGDLPLLQYMVDLDHRALEVIFDLPFTDVQRRESQWLLIEEWKGMPQAKKQEWVTNLKTWVELPFFRNYECNLQRAFIQTRLLEQFRKKDASERARWLLAQYKSAYRPGSKHNPVLSAGDPPLTQQLVDRYRDYLEVILDLSVSGGFTADQRKVLQDHLVKGWKKMRAKEREELLADLKRWSDATAGGVIAEANKAIPALRNKLLAQLYTAAADPRSRWLLEIAAQERKQFELMSASQRKVYETQMQMARNIAPSGEWRFSGGTGKMEWVSK